MDVRDYALVLAVDSADEKEAVRLSKDVGRLVDAVKVGVPTILGCGIGVVKKIKKLTGGPVVADLKVADIGFRRVGGRAGTEEWSGTNRKIVETAIGAGVDYVICHTIVGAVSFRECIETAHSMDGKVLTLPYMTGQGAGLFFDSPVDLKHVGDHLEGEAPGALSRLMDLAERKAKEADWRTTTLTTSDMIIVLGEEFGVDGYIAPANRPDVMADYRRVTTRPAFATGVGRQGGSIGEVYRILGPKSAAIVGSSICDAPNPAAASREFLLERDKMRKR